MIQLLRQALIYVNDGELLLIDYFFHLGEEGFVVRVLFSHVCRNTELFDCRAPNIPQNSEELFDFKGLVSILEMLTQVQIVVLDGDVIGHLAFLMENRLVAFDLTFWSTRSVIFDCGVRPYRR